jgi:hypothetical protein
VSDISHVGFLQTLHSPGGCKRSIEPSVSQVTYFYQTLFGLARRCAVSRG